jgi:hypothetical protein
VDQLRTVAEQEQPESEPSADAIRGAAGTAAIARRLEQEEARRLHEESYRTLELLDEFEGIGRTPPGRKYQPQPLGISHFPESTDSDEERPHTSLV